MKKSVGTVIGGIALSSVASPVSAVSEYDLDNDFEVIQSNSEPTSEGDAYVDALTEVYRPKASSDLERDHVRAAKTTLDISASSYRNYDAVISMEAKNEASLDEDDDGVAAVGPGNTIGSTSYTVGFSAGAGTGGAQAGVSASNTLSKSNLDIDDQTEPQNDLMKHDYTFSGDLQENRIVIDGTAIFDTLFVDEFTDAFAIDWHVDTYSGRLSGSTTHSHVEGDLS